MPETSSSNKRIVKNTMALYTRQILVMLVTLYTSRVILNTLGVDDFGIYNVVGGVVTMFSFITNTMTSASQRYIAYDIALHDKNKTKETFSLIILSYLMLAFLFFVLAESVAVWFLNTRMNIPADRMGAANWVLQFSILSFLVTMFQMPYLSMCIAKEHMNVYAYVSVAEAILRLSIVFLLTAFGYDKLKVYAVLMFLTACIVFSLYRWYCIRKFEESHFKFYYDKKRFIKLTFFAWWNMIGTLANVLRSQGVNILLNLFFNPAVNAARAIAFQVNNAIINFSNNFYTAVKPQIVKNYAKHDIEKMNSLIIRSSRLAYYLILLVSLPIFLNTKQLLTIWLKNPPEYSVLFVKIVLINVLLEVFSMPLASGMQATGNIKAYQLTVSVLYLLVIPISYIFLKTGCPPETPMIVNLIVVFISILPRLVLCHRHYSLSLKKYCIEVFAHVLLTTVICYIIGTVAVNLIKPTISITYLAEAVLITILSSLVIIFVLGLNNKERRFIIGIVKAKINKRKIS